MSFVSSVSFYCVSLARLEFLPNYYSSLYFLTTEMRLKPLVDFRPFLIAGMRSIVVMFLMLKPVQVAHASLDTFCAQLSATKT